MLASTLCNSAHWKQGAQGITGTGISSGRNIFACSRISHCAILAILANFSRDIYFLAPKCVQFSHSCTTQPSNWSLLLLLCRDFSSQGGQRDPLKWIESDYIFAVNLLMASYHCWSNLKSKSFPWPVRPTINWPLVTSLTWLPPPFFWFTEFHPYVDGTCQHLPPQDVLTRCSLFGRLLPHILAGPVLSLQSCLCSIPPPQSHFLSTSR